MSFDMVQDMKLLKNLPDSWRVLEFNKVIEDNTRNAEKIQKNDYLENGKIAIVDQGQNLIAGYSNDEENAYCKCPLIIFGDHTRILKYIDFPIYLGADGTKLLDIKEEVADTKYVYYFLNTLNIPSTGYNRHFKYLKDVHIPIPPLETQKKIADTLDKAQELIGKRKEQISALDKFLENLFLDMFGDPVSNPMGWDKFPVKDFGNIVTGNTPPRADEGNYGNYLEWIKSDNINTPYTYLTRAAEYLSEEGARKGRIVEKGSVLITCIAGSLSCIGNVAIADRTVTFNQQINAIVPNTQKITTYFLYNLIINTKKYIQDSSTKGMKGMISKGVFENLEFILPPLDLQNQFVSIVEKVEAEKTKLEDSLKEMEDNFNSIMQRAFKGELF